MVRLEPFLTPLFFDLNELVFMTAADMVCWGGVGGGWNCGETNEKMYE